MKKFVAATAAAAFILGTSAAMAGDTKQTDPTKKTATEQQMQTQSTSGAKAPAATTGSGMNNNMNNSSQPVPGKPTDTTKDIDSK
jgi:hypothetical protein